MLKDRSAETVGVVGAVDGEGDGVAALASPPTTPVTARVWPDSVAFDDVVGGDVGGQR